MFMKVLIVHSGNKSTLSPYIKEQAESLIMEGIIIEYFSINKTGVKGYLSCLPAYIKKVKSFNPNVIHAHFGLSGFFANLQRSIPVITSFHGSDIYLKKNRNISKVAYLLSKESIFVSNKLKTQLGVRKGKIITCGVDIELFKPASKHLQKGNFILFSGAFNNKVKNYPLAKNALEIYNRKYSDNNTIELFELINKTREEVVELMNQAQLLLITSTFEGSSQVLKEAMACNCPVVATNVGSVQELLGHNSSAGIIIPPNPEKISEAINRVIQGGYYAGRHKLIQEEVTLEQVAKKIVKIYQNLIH